MNTRFRQDLPSGTSVAVEFDSDEPIERLRSMRAACEQLDAWRRQLVAEARKAGASWTEIGEALGMSRQAVWEFYNADIREILDRASNASGLTEDEAMELAVREVAEVRRQRRQRKTA